MHAPAAQCNDATLGSPGKRRPAGNQSHDDRAATQRDQGRSADGRKAARTRSFRDFHP
jgi:hypothetical protein